jgi:hypothetical protein
VLRFLTRLRDWMIHGFMACKPCIRREPKVSVSAFSELTETEEIKIFSGLVSTFLSYDLSAHNSQFRILYKGLWFFNL